MTVDNLDLFNRLRLSLAGEELPLNLDLLNSLTLGQLEQFLAEGSVETYDGLLSLLYPIFQTAGVETARAYSLLARQIREHQAGQGPKPDWTPLLESLKRERTEVAITDDTSLGSIFALVWETHVAQD